MTLEKQPASTRPQEAQIFVRMVETGGRAVERKLVLPVAPATALIGIKPLFGDKNVAEGDKAEFDIVFVSPEGKTLPRDGLRYELLKMESRYQWYRQNNYWEYEPVKSTSRVSDGDVTIAADKPSRISLTPRPGRYRLDVKSNDADGPVTSVQFDVGWYSDGSADTPDLLETSIDKPQYASGDTMTVSVNVRTAGKLTVNVLGDRLLTTQTIDVKEGTAQVKLPVGKDWGTGAYVVATLRRPLDAAAQRMPGRAIGLKWFGIDKQTRTLQVKLTPPALIRPNATLKIPVKLDGLNPGEDAKVVIAAVDVGILNLTNYKPPAPDDYYLGQRRLSAEIRDLYGQLIDGMSGTRGQIKSGGECRRGRAAGLAARAEAARALFGHRHRRRRRHRGSQLRHSGVRRHRARDGGGVDRDQARPRQHRRRDPRSRGADHDPAALPAQRRPRHGQSRDRQCRGPGRRLRHQREDRR